MMLFVLSAESPAQTLAKNVSNAGTTAATFLEIPVGAAAVGMGGAFVSLANDGSALYWNVAGSALLPKSEVIIVHTNWIADSKFDFAGLVLPLGSFGTLGFSLTSLSMGDMKVRTVEMPDGTGEFFSAGDLAGAVSYSRTLTDRFAVGMTLKYIQQRIWHESASAFAVDIGTLFRTDLFGGMVIGASLSNFGTRMQMAGRDTRYFIRLDPSKTGSNDRIPSNIEMDTWDLPLLFQLGVSTDVVKSDANRWTVTVDALHPSDNYESLNVGTEVVFEEFLFLRGGYKSLFLNDAEGGMSFGVGVKSSALFSGPSLSFDYAYRDFGRLVNIQVFSLSIRF
ncbi:MAG: PorV/PorQ family protein [Ignavibacteriales bacterium]|nr:PorV/PorQ family protein [Ignavibacteriales bacterium]